MCIYSYILSHGGEGIVRYGKFNPILFLTCRSREEREDPPWAQMCITARSLRPLAESWRPLREQMYRMDPGLHRDDG